jgi:CRP/FNR family nitrogen fixation transcriptional regulator
MRHILERASLDPSQTPMGRPFSSERLSLDRLKQDHAMSLDHMPHQRRRSSALEPARFDVFEDRVPPKFDARWCLGIVRGDEDAVLTDFGGRVINVEPRHCIVNESDPARCSYFILHGSVMVAKMLPDGRRQILELLGPGDICGVTSTATHESTVETLTQCRIVAFDRRAMAQSTELQLVFAERLKSQFCALHDHAMLLGRKGALERVCTFLMRLIPGRGGDGCSGPSASQSRDATHVSVALTRQEIADYLGLTLETVSRAFSQLKREGVVSYGRNDDVTIRNICALCHRTGAH